MPFSNDPYHSKSYKHLEDLENIYMDCILITGKSAAMKTIIIDEVLKPHNFYFYENEGNIKVSSF